MKNLIQRLNPKEIIEISGGDQENKYVHCYDGVIGDSMADYVHTGSAYNHHPVAHTAEQQPADDAHNALVHVVHAPGGSVLFPSNIPHININT